MATPPTSSHLFTRDSPILQTFAEANQQLPQPCLFGHQVNKLPPPYHSRSPTLPDLSIKDLKADDPELLLKLKRNASTFVANWVRYRDESMTEEEKRHECQQIARREQEKEEEFNRLFENTCRESTGLFVMPVSRDAKQQSQGRDLAKHASIQAEEVSRAAASLPKGQKVGETA
jgi:hypothetical protein